MASKLRSNQHPQRAFSLIETIAVISIISLVASFVVPVLSGTTSSTKLSTGARQMAGWLNVARSEAISRRTLVRFVVALEWPGRPESNQRTASLWAWDQDAERFFQFTGWQELPSGIILEKELPEYIKTAAYAADDRSATKGDFVLGLDGDGSPPVDIPNVATPVPVRFVEFTAAGAARVPGATGRQAMFVLTPGAVNADGSVTRTTNANGHAANWAQLNVDKLTGRVRIHQP